MSSKSSQNIENNISEEEIKTIQKKYQIFRLQNENINEIFKIFNEPQQEIFNTKGSKKQFSKILKQLNKFFITDISFKYFQLLFSPKLDKDMITKRNNIINEISNIESQLLQEEVKNSLKNLKTIEKITNIPYTLITFEEEIREYFLENYKLSLRIINNNELEEMLISNDIDKNTILITDENTILLDEIQILNSKQLKQLIDGYIIEKNSNRIENIVQALSKIQVKHTSKIIEQLTNYSHNISDIEKIQENLNSLKNNKNKFNEIIQIITKLENEVEQLNKDLKDQISQKKISLDGEDLIEALHSNSTQKIQEKLEKDISKHIKEKENQILDKLKSYNIKPTNIFESSNYPAKLEEGIKEELLNQVEELTQNSQINSYINLGKICSYENLLDIYNIMYFIDMFRAVLTIKNNYSLNFPSISQELFIKDSKNINIKNSYPIDYGLNTDKLNLSNEKISILTGANSGGKTTILETILQSYTLFSMGLGISANAKNSYLPLVDEVIFMEKFSGTQGSGAFEQTIKYLLDILDSNSKKLILIDEFEAITEPGAAAKILTNFLIELSKTDSFCICVSHLGDEIKEVIDTNNISSIRVDGISASGIDEKGNLITNHQPQFYSIGKSTPEFILKRISNDEKFWKNKSKNTKDFLEKIINKNSL